MKLFLTGEIQVGKSTVIARTLTLLNRSYGGFKTYFGPDRGCEDRLLYMNSAADSNVFTENYGIVRFRKDCCPQVLTDKFDTDGVELIRSARVESDLIIMDECGNFERHALQFQKEILETLDGDKPVLGVIKLASTGFTDILRNHPKVKLIMVTRENRDELPPMLVHDLQGGSESRDG